MWETFNEDVHCKSFSQLFTKMTAKAKTENPERQDAIPPKWHLSLKKRQPINKKRTQIFRRQSLERREMI